MNIYQFEKQKKKASKKDWFKNGIRTDLNTLIVKTNKQNELIEALIKKVELLSSERSV